MLRAKDLDDALNSMKNDVEKAKQSVQNPKAEMATRNAISIELKRGFRQTRTDFATAQTIARWSS